MTVAFGTVLKCFRDCFIYHSDCPLSFNAPRGAVLGQMSTFDYRGCRPNWGISTLRGGPAFIGTQWGVIIAPVPWSMDVLVEIPIPAGDLACRKSRKQKVTILRSVHDGKRPMRPELKTLKPVGPTLKIRVVLLERYINS